MPEEGVILKLGGLDLVDGTRWWIVVFTLRGLTGRRRQLCATGADTEMPVRVLPLVAQQRRWKALYPQLRTFICDVLAQDHSPGLS